MWRAWGDCGGPAVAVDGLSWLGMGVESLGWAWRASDACRGPGMGVEPVMGVEGLEWSVDGLGWMWRSWDRGED